MPSGRLVAAALAVAIAVAFGAVLSAHHAWSSYHWARTSPSFGLTVVNSTTSEWDGFVSAAVVDWSLSEAVDLIEDRSGSTSRKERRQCVAPAGMVRICNLAYGNTGWLGVAGISIDGDGHIFTGYTKLNDSYFSTGYYNTYNWRRSVTCQELGHDIGLDHQDEDFYNQPLSSCMDYQDPPFPEPNAHDFEQLDLIYAHLDPYDSYAAGGGEGGGCNAPPGKGCNKAGFRHGNSPKAWGRSLGRRGAKEKFIRTDPDGTRHITFVTWAGLR